MFCIYYDQEDCLANIVENSDTPHQEIIIAQIAITRDYLTGEISEEAFKTINLASAFMICGLDVKTTASMTNVAKMETLITAMSKISSPELLEVILKSKEGD